MAAQIVCPHNKFGYCKHLQMCRNLHVDIICENSSCDILSCMLRHPRPCRYHRDFGRCKFNPCAYLHVETENGIIEQINKEREIIKSKLAEVENTLEILNAKEIELTSIIDKLHQTEDKVNAVEKKVEELEAKLKERDNLIVKLLEKFENTSETFETISVESEVEIFKCNECNFETKSERGLNIHKKRKHHQKTICDICDEHFDSAREVKIHRYTHSYTTKGKIGQTCKNCNFTCDTMETIEVHLGKCNVEEFECGLCEIKFEIVEDLDMHLKTCEVYECYECCIRNKNLEEMKRHVQEDHEGANALNHLKMDRDDISKVTLKYYLLSEL